MISKKNRDLYRINDDKTWSYSGPVYTLNPRGDGRVRFATRQLMLWLLALAGFTVGGFTPGDQNGLLNTTLPYVLQLLPLCFTPLKLQRLRRGPDELTLDRYRHRVERPRFWSRFLLVTVTVTLLGALWISLRGYSVPSLYFAAQAVEWAAAFGSVRLWTKLKADESQGQLTGTLD